MVVIRLTRAGSNGNPYYRIVAMDSRAPRDGRPLEFLGSFDPKPTPAKIRLEAPQIDAWVAKGAKLSPTVRSLIRRARRQAQAAGGAS
jgi:small subunit ribosomal protein S16